EAQTVNGEIVASIGGATWSDALEFRTVNGAITLNLPANLSTEVRAKTINGDIQTDFPLMVTGRLGPRSVRGTIGSGGRRLALETVNGSIRLRKSTWRSGEGGGESNRHLLPVSCRAAPG